MLQPTQKAIVFEDIEVLGVSLKVSLSQNEILVNPNLPKSEPFS